MELDIQVSRVPVSAKSRFAARLTSTPRRSSKSPRHGDRGGCNNVIVNLEGVGFIDSSGLGVLVSALRRAREREGAVRIVCTRENILKIFRITGWTKSFRCSRTFQRRAKF